MRIIDRAESLQFIQDRLDTEAWWIVLVISPESADVALEINKEYRKDGNEELVDLVVVPFPTPDVPFLSVLLAAKSCMPPERLAKLIGIKPRDRQDIVVHPTTPISIICWLNATFRFRD